MLRETTVQARKLSHLLLLAKYGLSTFRDENSTPAARVFLLSAVLAEKFPKKVLTNPWCESPSVDNTKTSLLFDLMKESPHVLFRDPDDGSGDTKRGTKRKLIAFEA